MLASRRTVVALGAALALLPVGCSATPVSEQQIELEQRRLLQPFVGEAEVGCTELVIEMTANFNPFVSQPAIDPKLHAVRKEVRDGFYETVYRNKFGDPASGFTVVIGELATETAAPRGTRYTVFNEVRVRVAQGLTAMALDVKATGRPLVMRQGGAAGQMRDLTEYEVHDGALRAR